MTASAAVMAAVLVVIVAGAPRAAQAYQDRRLAEHPCREAIAYLDAEAGGLTRTLAMDDTALWSELNPWLHTAYRLVVVDGYNPDDRPLDEVAAEKLAAFSAQGEFWWIERSEAAKTLAWSPAAANFFARPGVYTGDVQQLGACALARVFALPDAAPLATFATGGGRIELFGLAMGAASRGAPLPVVLYWRTPTGVDASYTVFTQLFAPDGQMVAQQDNLPVGGLAPTDTWTPGQPVRDAYSLSIPADAPSGRYTLHVGLYDAAGRQPATLRDGAAADHLTITVDVR
jgi:hypothetical protein